MAAPKGTRPPNAGKGRKKGVPNKVTAEIKALAQLHGEPAIKELARLARKAKSEMVRVAAIGELLNRGYGKATQHIEHTGQISLIDELKAARERAGISEPQQPTAH